MVMADFSKEFDTICFRNTLLKLHKLGFTKPPLKWLLSYLCDRRQFLQVDDEILSCQTIAFGIPQGSILGPMSFNLYVSSLHLENAHSTLMIQPFTIIPQCKTWLVVCR